MPRTKKADSPDTAIQQTMVEETIIQHDGSEWNMAELKEKAIAAYVAEGHHRGRIKKLTLYVKPEDRKVYYVINEKTSGSIDFDE